MKGVTIRLYSTPWNIKKPPTYTYMNDNRKSAIFIQKSHFAPILIYFQALYFNELLLQIEHHRLPINSVSSSNLEHEQLSKALAYFKHVGLNGGTVHFHASP